MDGWGVRDLMSLLSLRDAIIASITSEISAFVEVREYGGRFTKADLEWAAHRSPAAFVAVLGAEGKKPGGQPVANAAIIASVVVRGRSDNKRESASLLLAQAVFALALRNHWDYSEAKEPVKVRMTNLYSSALDEEGFSIWAVGWAQETDVDPFDISELDEFHTADSKIDLAFADGVYESDQLVQVGGEFMSAYGNIYISASAATAIAVADTYQKAAGSTTLKLSGDSDMPVAGRLRHIGTVAKPFLVTASAAAIVDSDALVTLGFAKNGVVDEDTEIEQEATLAGGAEAFSLKTVMSLDENDYVEVWVKADGTVNVTLTKMTLVLAAT